MKAYIKHGISLSIQFLTLFSSFQAVNQDQFFQIITSQANADNRRPVGATIKGIMDTWTLQKGFPLVKVSLNGDILTFTQVYINIALLNWRNN
jgi:aminopeptidase N